MYNTIELQALASAQGSPDRLYKLLEAGRDVFTDPKLAQLFDIFRDLADTDRPVDFPSIGAELKSRGLDEDGELLEALCKAETTVNIGTLIKTLQTDRRRQEIRALAADISNMAKTASLELIEARLMDYIERAPRSTEGVNVKDMAVQPLADVFQKLEYLKTGITSLDNKITGLSQKSLNIIAARPGLGKSSLALQLAGNITGKVLFFSLEMGRQELYARLLSMWAEVEAWKLETHRLDEQEYCRVKQQADGLANSGLVIYDSAYDLNNIINITRRERDVRAVFIDYLQLLGGLTGETQNLRIAGATRRLKQLAMQLDIPVILMSQLSRGSEREGRAPVLSDLRDSGGIEQDADLVMFLHEPDDSSGHNILIAKNRRGATGKLGVTFEKQFTRFIA